VRVLYFSRDYTPHDHRFLTALAGTQHQVAYLRLEDDGRALESQPLPSGIEVIAWAGGKRPARFEDGWGLLTGLRKVLRTWRPDLVHAGPIQTCAFLTALAGFRPLLSMTWGYDLLFDARRNLFWNWVTRYTLWRSTLLAADCNTLRRVAVGFGMNPARTLTFPWGVDLLHFSPLVQGAPCYTPLRERLGWGEGTFVLLSTRAFAPIYGTLELAQAFAKAAQARPELRLLMLGGGAQEGVIRQVFAEAGVLERVHWAGQVSRQELPQYYRAADVYVSASHSDGTSISLLEALASGCPALVSDIPGNREWVTQGEQGWLFPVGQVEALTQAMMATSLDARTARQMRYKARRTAEERGDWEVNFQVLLRAYETARQAGG